MDMGLDLGKGIATKVLIVALVILIPIIGMMAAVPTLLFGGSGDKNTVDLVEVLVNHHAVPEYFTGDGFEWVQEASDEIYNFRQNRPFKTDDDASQEEKDKADRKEDMAVAIMYNYWISQNKSILPDGETRDDYAACFSGEDYSADSYDMNSDPTWAALANIGIDLDDGEKQSAVFSAKMIHDRINRITDSSGLVDGDASKVTPSGSTDGASILNARPGNDRYDKAIAAFKSAYGHVCYDGRGYLQCVSVSEWYLVAVYHASYVGGNGRDIVRNALARDPDKLTKLDDWTAGAVFSVQGYDGYGHTGYVAKVDKAAGKVWLTEAWGSNGTYHENREWRISDFYSYYGSDVSFCIGTEFYKQLQEQAAKEAETSHTSID